MVKTKTAERPITERVLAVLSTHMGWDKVRLPMSKLCNLARAASAKQVHWAIEQLIREGRLERLERPGDYRVIELCQTVQAEAS